LKALGGLGQSVIGVIVLPESLFDMGTLAAIVAAAEVAIEDIHPIGHKKALPNSLSHDFVSVGKPTLPETYHGFVNSTVNLNGRMEGCFPFDIYLTLKPFDYRKRAIDELRLWYNILLAIIGTMMLRSTTPQIIYAYDRHDEEDPLEERRFRL